MDRTSHAIETAGEITTPISNRRVNPFLVVAFFIATATFFIHVIGGGATVWQPVADSPLAEEPKLVSLAVWHMASVALGLSAIAFAVGSLPRFAQQSRYLVVFVSLMWVGFALCFVATALTSSGENILAALPQPILLFPVGVLGLIASRRIA